MHVTCEAAVIAKTEALAENFARVSHKKFKLEIFYLTYFFKLHDPEAVEEEVGKAEVVKVKPPREDKFGALYEHSKYSIHTGVNINHLRFIDLIQQSNNNVI